MEKTITVEIITIGDELLIGQVVDTNSAWMAQQLNERGLTLKQITSIHDDREHIITALDEAFRRADIVLTTGGLGPTKDDITKLVMADYFHMSLVENQEVKAHILDLYKERPDVLNRLTETQWLVPDGATILTNRVGSAPLMVFRHGNQVLASMPGVPYEMKIAMQEQILPYLDSWLKGVASAPTQITHRTLMVTGIPESSLAILLEDWEMALPSYLHLAYLPKDGTIRLRLSLYGSADNEKRMEEEWLKLNELVAPYLVIDEDLALEQVIGKRLMERKETVSTAESCTGGRLASLFTKWPGSSAWYMGSVVAYDNRVKEGLLGVSPDNLRQYGAVSEQVVRQMAEGVRRATNTTWGIATSGIAGPGGGSEEKPVGTVWMAWAGPDGTEAECFHLGKLREQVMDRALMKAMIHLLRRIS